LPFPASRRKPFPKLNGSTNGWRIARAPACLGLRGQAQRDPAFARTEIFRITNVSRPPESAVAAPALPAHSIVHPKLPLAESLPTATMAHGHPLGLCWGARPSRLPFSASRQKPFPKLNGSTHGSGATPEPARETGALPSFVQPKLLLARSVFAAGHPAAGVWRSGFREKAAIQFSSRFAALCRDAATSVADFS
jgi:hypothetical protein